MKILLYGNGGSGNHGCEAIARGTITLLGNNNDYCIYSAATDEDIRYGLESIAEIKSATTQPKRDTQFYMALLKTKLLHKYVDLDGLAYLERIQETIDDVDIALSVGGDNYCYEGTQIYPYLNNAFHKAGMKTVLWGCSVEPKVLKSKAIIEDMKRYNLIVARESITYNALLKITDHVILAPDPAFSMIPQPCVLDKRIEWENVIGLNISPMIVSNESKPEITMENYKNLIRYILNETECNIALIPHVVWNNNDDRSVLRQLYNEFSECSRIILVEDHTAPELKYIISKCRLFVGARTHATIAAYSTCVPTLVVGYSVKARGIAKDLFGTIDDYVIPVQSLSSSDDLTFCFSNMFNSEKEIREYLERKIPEYILTGKQVVQKLQKLNGEKNEYIRE